MKHKSSRLAIVATLAAILGILSGSPGAAPANAAPTCDISFDGSSSTSWSTGANWDLGRVPNPGEHACIPAALSAVHSTGTTSIGSVQIVGSLTLSGGTLTLTDTANDSILGSMVHSGGTLAGAATASIPSGGTYTWTGGQMAGAGTTRVAAGGTLSISGGFQQLWDTRSLEILGLAHWDGGGIGRSGTPSIEVSGMFRVVSDSTLGVATHISPTGTLQKLTDTGTTILQQAVENDGTIDVQTGTLSTSGPFTNTGTVDVGDGATFATTGDYIQALGQTRLLGSASVVNAVGGEVVVTGGSLVGVGTAGPVIRNSGGAVAPGLSVGELSGSSYIQEAGGTTSVEITGTTPGTQHDLIVLDEDAALAGTLEVVTDGFQPAEGDSFSILTCGGTTPCLAGRFSAIVGDIGDDLVYRLHADPNAISLVAQPRVARVALQLGDRIARPGTTVTATARVEDLDGDPLADVPIDWSVQGQGSITAAEVITDATGTATASLKSSQPGNLEVTVEIGGCLAGADCTKTITQHWGPEVCDVFGTRGADLLKPSRSRLVTCGFGGADVFVGTAGRDIFYGSGGGDEAGGKGGNDRLEGGAGEDVLAGGGGEDVMAGNGGRDRLSGGSQADSLNGGPQRDSCRGGPGRDKLRSCE